MRRLLPFLLAAFATLAAAQADPDQPSRPVGRTHDCANFYPPEAQRRNESGDVMVRYDVRADGRIAGVTVLKSSGHADLDAAAIQCVQAHWRNTPAYRNGMPVASPDHRAIIAFRLEGDAAAPAIEPQVAGGGFVALVSLTEVIGVVMLLVAAAAIVVFVVVAFPRRRRGPVSGPVVCGKCGVVNIVPEKYFRRRKCTGCGQPFNI